MINGLLFDHLESLFCYSFENSWVIQTSLVDWNLSYWVVPQKIVCKPGGWMAPGKGFTIVPAGCSRLGTWWRKNISLCSKQKTPGYFLRKMWDFRSFLSTIKWKVMFCPMQEKKKKYPFCVTFSPRSSWELETKMNAGSPVGNREGADTCLEALVGSLGNIPTARETSPLVASGNMNG